MVQIVTNILPHLSSHARPESELKSGFVILLGESMAEVVWAALREAREDMPGDDRGTTVLSNLFELQKALDAPHTDKEHVEWVRLLQKLAQEIVARVEGMVEKNPDEWKKAGAMPEGCEIGNHPLKDCQASGDEGAEEEKEGGEVDEIDEGLAVDQIVKDEEEEGKEGKGGKGRGGDGTTWTTKLSRVLERALLRTLRRQPTRRVDVYDQFVELWLEREIKKVMGQRGVAVTPQQLHLEVRVTVWCGLWSVVVSQVLSK